jgi:hypothetical protein
MTTDLLQYPLLNYRHKTKIEKAQTQFRESKTDKSKSIPFDWKPFQNSPQEFAFYHPADILFYGGKAGAGKTDLLLGVAGHNPNSLILRREFPRARAIIERSRAIFSRGEKRHEKDSYNESLHLWRLANGNTIEIGGCQYENDKNNYQGRDHAAKLFDEITEFSESQFRFINIWARHADPNVRSRVIATGNPPTNVDGEWVIDFWGAFVDPDHEDPAEDGGICWYATITENDEDKDIELREYRLSRADVQGYIERKELPPRPEYKWVKPDGSVKIIKARSRAFVSGSVEDNPVMMQRGYDQQLDALPEFLRMRFREGLFQRVTESTDLQVIPTAWIVAAQDRWVEFMGTKSLDYNNALSIYRTKNQSPNMSALGVDPSRGGDDETAIAIRFNDWIAPLHLTKGKYVEDGDAVRDIIHNLRIGNPQINIDVVGVGSSPYDSCKKMGWTVVAINGGASATDRNNKPITDRTGLLRFRDMNAMLAWRLMEALDPQYNPTLMLPPDPKLKAELCSIRRSSIDGGVVSIESKKEVKKRLGRSPDRADAVKYALLQTLSLQNIDQRSKAMALGKVSEWQ